MISIPEGGFASGSGGLLILLIAGHIFGDFLLQTPRMAALKEFRVWPLLAHGVLVLVAHLAALVPVLTPLMAIGIAGVAVFHLLTDMVRTRLCGPWAGTFAAFISDQMLHVATLVGLWLAVGWWPEWRAGGLAGGAEWLPTYIRWVAVVAAFSFNARGGTMAVTKTLDRFARAPEDAPNERRGSELAAVIGTLERFVILTLLIFGQWTAAGFVIAARFLYYLPGLRRDGSEGASVPGRELLGTLTSIFVALVSGILVRLVIG